MNRYASAAFPLLCASLLFSASVVGAQSIGRARPKVSGTARPECRPGAICFSGNVSEGQEFRKALNTQLEFALQPGWNIAIVPKQPEGDCREFAFVVNAPYRAHGDLYIDETYGWSAEQEVSASPREFRFVMNCADYRTEMARLNIVLWPYTATPKQEEEALAKLGSSPLGKGRLWITESKISHSRDTPEEKLGRIEWMNFSAEIQLPLP